jgi:polysaccharide pyruvyl transferase WcaK-like protein
LERARAVVLRDPESVRLARELGVTADKITEAADLALLLKPARAAEAENLLGSVDSGQSTVDSGGGEEARAPICGVILRGWGGKEPWEAAAEACDYASEHLGMKCLLLPFQPEDRALAWRVASTARTAPAVLETPVTPAEMLALIGRLGVVVTMRLHGLIFAAAQEVPALGLSYDPKVTAFAAQAGQRILPLEGLSALNLRVAVEDLWASRGAIAPARAAAAGKLREKAEVNWTVLEEVAEGLETKNAN